MRELTFTAMQHHLPHEYLTLQEAAGWARVSPEKLREAVLVGDLRSVASSLIRVRDLDRWAQATRAAAARGGRSARQLRNDAVQFIAQSDQAV